MSTRGEKSLNISPNVLPISRLSGCRVAVPAQTSVSWGHTSQAPVTIEESKYLGGLNSDSLLLINLLE
ncbi:hypothetical protein CVT25_006229 [Psilocybe cyanescens]|uniref:Uncharacterized protein n=1 Tax=Psilocybe cyanescens TaxID=93625 RepID=A0A409XKP4_PSICY|nr:hypothetical protein CVT25_006229 [Psilocybe cyanescens]